MKQGCIILGETQSGKTSLIKILETALNKASNNELKLRVAQARKSKLRQIAIDWKEEQKNAEIEAAIARKRDKKKEDEGGLGIKSFGNNST